jgi:RimJ/RimL family protein N-acetyltransferase
MEKMPFRAELETGLHTVITTASTEAVSTDWRDRLPVLAGQKVVLRDLRPSDATSLFTLLTTEEVARFISPPPSTLEGFERFIMWAHRQRRAGAYACFAVTLPDDDIAIGIFQLRELEPGFGTAEWGFAIGSPFWGTGVFRQGAELLMDFAFDIVGVHRLEARAAVKNGRGNSALQKIGAVQEGVLRKSFLRNGEYLDQVLYAIVDDDWRATRQPSTPGVRVH